MKQLKTFRFDEKVFEWAGRDFQVLEQSTKTSSFSRDSVNLARPISTLILGVEE